MNAVTKYEFEYALYNRKFIPKTLERILAFIFSSEAHYIRYNKINKINENIPIEILIHILSFLAFKIDITIFSGYGGCCNIIILTNEGKLYGTVGRMNYRPPSLCSENLNIFTNLNEIETINKNIKYFACGYGHILILTSDDTVYAIGTNEYGQLGLNDNNHRSNCSLVDIENVKQISCGEEYTIILTHDGNVFATGNNMYGQLGLNDKVDRNSFTQVDVENVKQICCGNWYTMILTYDGNVFSTGNNEDGHLGLNDTIHRHKFTQVKNINNVKQISCGNQHNMLLTNDGRVYAAGNNYYGQLGLNNKSTNIISPRKLKFTYIEGIENIKQVSCGNQHTLLLTNEGKLYATGYNACGELGLNDTINRNSFTQVNIDNVKQISCGQWTNTILTNDMNVYSTGENDIGQLGLNDTIDRKIFTQTNLTSIIPNLNKYKLA